MLQEERLSALREMSTAEANEVLTKEVTSLLCRTKSTRRVDAEVLHSFLSCDLYCLRRSTSHGATSCRRWQRYRRL